MWFIVEADRLERKWRRLPVQVLKKYELWKSIVRYNGPQGLRGFPGFHDEKLRGGWEGYRSSRLNIHFRVVYQPVAGEKLIRVEDVIPHNY